MQALKAHAEYDQDTDSFPSAIIASLRSDGWQRVRGDDTVRLSGLMKAATEGRLRDFSANLFASWNKKSERFYLCKLIQLGTCAGLLCLRLLCLPSKSEPGPGDDSVRRDASNTLHQHGYDQLAELHSRASHKGQG